MGDGLSHFWGVRSLNLSLITHTQHCSIVKVLSLQAASFIIAARGSIVNSATVSLKHLLKVLSSIGAKNDNHADAVCKYPKPHQKNAFCR
jgi:hypothetical protein